ncbi:MAG: hypothetical protein KF812_09335 [Fimbriimonadaceae bacterium]|nr:hypothetical protein [Fimbriimonadaceae bacterium]
MSLRINTNIPALNAARYLTETDNMLSRSTGRLSSGLRINTAADDPAGLIVSEGLRAQIKGLDQAMRNAQDAINMSRTAEGALDEVQTLLRNIRGLAVQSANTAVVDAAQLEANQTQIRSTLQSINRIAAQTTFGTKKLLNGASGATASVTRTDLVSNLFIGSEMNGERVRNGAITMQRVTQATRATTTLATTFAAGTTAVNAGSFVINGQTFTVTPGMNVNDVLVMINQKTPETNVQATHVAGAGVVLTSTKYGSNFGINYYESANAPNTTILNNNSAPTVTAGINAVFNVTTNIEPSGTATEVFTGGQGSGVDGLTLISPSGYRLNVSTAGNNTAALTTIGQLDVGSLRFQLGPNVEQSANFSLPSMYADRLGRSVVPGQDLSTINVTTQTGAENAMRIIDAAISEVASIRGNLGSFTKNFLESTYRSLSIANENTTAAESTVRDADMAIEMADFTRLQILRQSGMAMLAQASRQPQQILQLLQGG